MQIRSITCPTDSPYLVELDGHNFVKFIYNSATINIADNRNMANSFPLVAEEFLLKAPFKTGSQIWITGDLGTEILGIMKW